MSVYLRLGETWRPWGTWGDLDEDIKKFVSDILNFTGHWVQLAQDRTCWSALTEKYSQQEWRTLAGFATSEATGRTT